MLPLQSPVNFCDMKILKMKQILFSIQPLLNICKFLGFFPLNILNVKDRKSTAIYVMIIGFFILLYILVAHARITFQFGQATKGSNLSKIANYLSIALMLAMMVILKIGNFIKRQKLMEILRILEKIDSKVSTVCEK